MPCAAAQGGKMRRPHALVMPCAAQGHINPLMQLAQHLVACHGFQITFVNTHTKHASIVHSLKRSNNLLHETATTCRSASYPDITLVGLDSHDDDDDGPSGHEAVEDFKQVIQHFVLLPFIPLIDHLISHINLSPTPLSCIIADAFLYWLPPIARSALIPSLPLFAFFPSSVANLSLLFHAPSLLSSGVLNSDGSLGGCAEFLTAIPGLPNIKSKDVPWIAGASDNHVMFDLTISTSNHLKDFDAILLNSYQELENEALDGLVKENLQVVPIGPFILLQSHENFHNVACSSLWEEDTKCLQWLEDKPNSSVLYIAFGSLANFNVRDLHELALGMEDSQQAFIWVLGPILMHKGNEFLPEGFLERTKDRALFVKWAPQSLVLSHPSIGAFLTHCGWNSTMEAISSGVPMLTWPCFGDQALICKYIIEEWKVGMPLYDHNFMVLQQGVKNVVVSIMVGMEGKKIRERISRFREKAKIAVEKKCGNSFQNLQNVVPQACHYPLN